MKIVSVDQRRPFADDRSSVDDHRFSADEQRAGTNLGAGPIIIRRRPAPGRDAIAIYRKPSWLPAMSSTENQHQPPSTAIYRKPECQADRHPPKRELTAGPIAICRKPS